MNEVMNNPDTINISNMARGWASGLLPPLGAQNKFNIWNTIQVPNPAGSEGTQGEWTSIAGDSTSGNSTATGGTATAGVANFFNWIECNEANDNNNFVDLNPIWNTSTGGRLGIFAASATNVNITGGGWNWRFRTDGADTARTLELKGGIFDNTGFTRTPINTRNTNINKLSGGTAYTVWWELIDPTALPGLQVDFYARKPGSKMDMGINNKNDPGTIRWASATLPAAPGARHSIGIRPVLDTTGATPFYSLEAYAGIADLAANTWSTLPTAATANGTPGKILIADPANVNTWSASIGAGRVNFDLYRNLPLRMGCNSGRDEYSIWCNSIHHNDAATGAMDATEQVRTIPYTFLLDDLTPLQQARGEAQGGSWDKNCRQILRKSNLAENLGYNTHYAKIPTATMLPANAGLPAAVDLGLTLPENHTLVVTLPDLPITGYYGNSSGDSKSGTLNMNSGGNSAAILGVIPVGNRPYKDPESIPFDDYNAARGEFFANPMENWISLNNPAPFSLSSIRCRITDELGNKPGLLQTTSTITIKIKKKSGREAFRQGGMNGVFKEA